MVGKSRLGCLAFDLQVVISLRIIFENLDIADEEYLLYYCSCS